MFKNNSGFWEKKRIVSQKFYYKLNLYVLLREKTFKDKSDLKRIYSQIFLKTVISCYSLWKSQ